MFRVAVKGVQLILCHLTVTITARTCLILSDIVLISITWYSLGSPHTTLMSVRHSHLSFAHVLLRDGECRTISRMSYIDAHNVGSRNGLLHVCSEQFALSQLRATLTMDILSVLLLLNLAHLILSLLAVSTR